MMKVGGVHDADATDEEQEDESTSEEVVVLPPDLPEWDKAVSFEGLGRDVVGLIAKRLNAADCFNLALTSHRTYDRIKALRLLQGAEARFMSRYPKSTLKSLQPRPLVLDMLTCPIPRLADLLPAVPEGAGKKQTCCVCYVDMNDGVNFMMRLFEMRGWAVHGKKFVSAHELEEVGRLVPKDEHGLRMVRDTPSKLIQRLRETGKLTERNLRATPGQDVRVGGVNLLAYGCITAEAVHYEFVHKCCEENELVLDVCYRTNQVGVMLRWLGETTERYMHLNVARFGVRAEIPFSKMPSPPSYSAAAVREALKKVPDGLMKPLLKHAQVRRELVLLLKSILVKGGSRLMRACNKLSMTLNNMGSRRSQMFSEHYVLSGEFDTLMFWLGRLVQPVAARLTESVVTPLPGLMPKKQ